MIDEIKAWLALALALDAGLVIIVLIFAETIDSLRARLIEIESRERNP